MTIVTLCPSYYNEKPVAQRFSKAYYFIKTFYQGVNL